MFCGPGKQIGPVGGPIKVWSLGDSITHGAIRNSNEPPDPLFDYEGSFRCALYAAMVAAGLNPSFLGNITNASDGVMCAGYGHTGVNAAHASAWNSSYFATYSPGIDNPHVVNILLGANDANDDATAGEVFGVVDQALALWPACAVSVQTMFKAAGNDFDILNAGLRSRAATRPQVFIVDQADVLQLTDLSDGLHPTAEGYRKLADTLINAFLQRMVA